jgi:hypothetical protein
MAAVFCENGNELSSCIKGGEYLDQLRHYLLVTEFPVGESWFKMNCAGTFERKAQLTVTYAVPSYGTVLRAT